MSKVKKALCLVLSAAMLLSVLPISGFAYLHNPDGTEYSEANGDYAYGDEAFTPEFTSAYDPTVWADTQETTEILRLAAGSQSSEYGNKVVKATASGMPEVSSSACHKDTLYDRESLITPQVIMELYGVSNSTLLSNVSITSEGLTGANWGNYTSSAVGDHIKLVWTLQNPGTPTASGPDANITHVITFTYKGMQYTQYAYSHTEYILHPNGVNYYGSTDDFWSSTNGRISAFGFLVGANMKPGFASSEASWQRGYINGNEASTSGDSVRGLGSEGPVSEGFVQKKNSNSDSSHSTLYYSKTGFRNYNDVLGIFRHQSRGATDGNRALSTVWVDKYEDYLGDAGSSGNNYGQSNNLNMRFLFVFGENKNFYIGCIYCFQILGNNANAYGYKEEKSNGTPAKDTNGFSTADILAVNTNQWVAESGKSAGFNADNRQTLKNKGISNDGTLAQNENVAAGVGKGLGGYLIDRDTKQRYGYLRIGLGGVGPTESQKDYSDCWSLNWTAYGQFSNRDLTSNKNRATVGATMSVRFRVYDTTVLRQVIEKIDSGNFSAGQSFQFGGTLNSSVTQRTRTLTRNKSANPQEGKFYSGWDDFKAAYDTARQYIAAFDVDRTDHSFNGCTSLNKGLEQTAIDNAIQNLIDAYNNLGYQDDCAITIHHYLADASGNPVLENGNPVKVVPDETYYGLDSQGNPTRVLADVATPFFRNTNYSIYPLQNLRGYEPVSNTSFTGHLTHIYDGTPYGSLEIYDNFDIYTGSEFVFYYKPSNQNLLIHSNISSVGVYVATVRTNAVPDFAAIKTAIGNKAHYNYIGMYESSDFSGSAVTETGNDAWTMPNTSAHLYVKWAPKPVKLHVNAVDQLGNPVALTTGEYSTEVTPVEQDGALQAVTFASSTLAAPTGPAGYVWGATYYSDPQCENPVEWPITAKYEYGDDEDATYTIVDAGQGTTENTIELYTPFADNNYKITFYAMGGKLTDNGNEVSSMQVAFATGTPVSYPVPVRPGYTFRGWVDSPDTGANPINDSYISGSFAGAWTDYADGEYSPVESTITMTTSVGFSCYAVWKPNDITATFRLKIGASETSRYNSKQSSYPPITVQADQVSSADQAPPIPRRYGYLFQRWEYDSRTFVFGTSKYPLENFELEAKWEEVDDRAYADITTYIRNAGTDYAVDEQHGGETAMFDVARGDVVSVRFSVAGRFYSGSQAYVFGYNQDFFEEVTGVSLFEVNPDNPFIAETAAEINTVTQFNPQTQARFTNKDPYSGETVNARYVEVTIDPDVYTTGNYNLSSMDNQEYMIVLHLKVKDTATGSGSVWVATEALRQADNMPGPMFISWFNSPIEMIDSRVETYRVEFDTNKIVSTVTVDPTVVYQNYGITAEMPKINNVPQGSFVDGTTSHYYFGREGMEILDQYTVQATGQVKNGFPAAERYGYHIEGWYAGTIDQDGNTVYDETDEWIPGFYATEEQDGKTYYAKWAPDEFTLTFYEKDYTTIRGTVTAYYNQRGVTPVQYRSNNTEEFIGWYKASDPTQTIIDWSDDPTTGYRVTGDDSFYPKIRPTQKTIIIKAYVPDPEDSTAKIEIGDYHLDPATQASLGLELRYGDTICVVDAIPAQPSPGITYILYSDIEKLMNGTPYTSQADGSTFTPAAGLGNNKDNYEMYDTTQSIIWEINESNSNNDATNTNIIYIRYQGKLVTETFNAYFAFVNNSASTLMAVPGSYTGSVTTHSATIGVTDENDDYHNVQIVEWSVEGRYGDTYDFDAMTAGIVPPFGFELEGWEGAALSSRGIFRGNEWHPTYLSKTVTVTFLNNDGVTPVVGGSISSQKNPINKDYQASSFSKNNFTFYKGKLDAKPGYDLNGWSVGTKVNGAYVPANNTIYGSATTYIGSIDSSYFEVDGNNIYLYFVPYYTPKTVNIRYWTVKEDDLNPTQIGSNSGVYDSTFRTGDDPNQGHLTPPAQTGYTLKNTNGVLNWYTDINDLSGNFVADNIIVPVNSEGPIDYYAVYEANTYTVTFDANGGAWPNNITSKTDSVKYHQTIPAPDIDGLALTGYELKGWSDGTTTHYYNENMEIVLPALSTADNITLTAVWEPSTHTVTYKSDANTDYWVFDGSDAEHPKGVYGQAIPVPANPTKEGYTFEKWSDGTNEYTPAELAAMTMGDADLVYTATWTANTNIVTYKLDANTDYWVFDGSDAEHAKGVYGQDVPTPPAPTKQGYDFTGWTPEIPATMPDEPLVFTATFEPAKYTVTYKNDDGTDYYVFDGSDASHAKGVYGQAIPVPANDPGKQGYTFRGWFDGTNEYTSAQIAAMTMPANGLTFTARFEVNYHNVIYYFIYDAANPSNNIVYEIDGIEQRMLTEYGTAAAAIVRPAIEPERTGYDFGGWQGIPATMPDQDVVVVAKWDAIPYKLTFNYNDNATPELVDNNVLYGSSLDGKVPEDPSRPGYDFTGWSDGTTTYEHKANVEALTMPDYDLTFTAQWDARSYRISYYRDEPVGNSTKIGIKTVTFGGTIGEENVWAEPSKTGYHFTGWKLDGTDSIYSSAQVADLTLPANDINFIAQWEKNSYTLTFKDGYNEGDSGIINTGSVLYEGAINVPANPSRPGYNFTVWKDADNKEPGYYNNSMPAKDLTFTAQWQSHTYTVVYNYGQGAINSTGPASESVTYAEGVTVTLPDHNNYGAFYKTGWNFKGWYTTQADAEAANDNYISGSTWAVPAQTANGTVLNLYAGWTQNTYQITFNPDGGSNVTTITATYNEEITRPDDPTKDGYDFAGWYEGDNEFTAWTTMPARNIALTAHWTDHVYDDNQVVFVQPDDACLAPTYHGELTFNDNNPFESGNGTIWNDVEVTRGQGLTAYPTDVPELQNYRFMYWQCSADNAIYTADGTYVDADGETQVAQTLSSFVMPALANDTVVYFTAVYYRVEVSLEIQTTSEAGIVDKEEGDPEAITGYIYNVGEKNNEAKILSQLEVEGDGYIRPVPSKMNSIYGTGARIELYSNRNDAPSNAEPIETYYIIVFCDVDGSSHCNSSDMAIARKMSSAEERTWGLQQSASMLSDAEKILCTCYEKAADTNGDNKFDNDDLAVFEGYATHYYTAYQFIYDDENKKGYYQVVAA